MSVIGRLRYWWQLRTGVEETPFDGDVVGWIVSLFFHVAVLVVLAVLTMLIPTDDRLTLSTTPVVVERELVPEEFVFDVDRHPDLGTLGVAGVSNALAMAALQADQTEIAVESLPESFLADHAILDFELPVRQSPETSDTVVLKGEGTVGTSGAAGAIDRITNEILLSLDQRPTLVIWLFDQSGSLRQQREEIVARFDRVYEELGVIEAAGSAVFRRHRDKPLLTSVASFGRDVTLLTPQPTDDLEEITSSVRAVTDDPSGVENVFSAVSYLAAKYRHYRLKAPRRNVMIVVFTDEAGDDIDQLDVAVDRCRKYEMPVYVVGVPAPFGRRDAYVRYVDPDPEFDQRTQWVPVHQGPESLLPERLRLYFGDAPTDEVTIDSGFGPFGLTRLTYETGGVYFAVHPNRSPDGRRQRHETAVMSAYVARFFDPTVMRNYRPDYVSVAEYRRLLEENRARAALIQAASLSWTQPLKNPRLRFPKVNDAEFARDLSLAQRDAAELEPVVRRLVDILRQGEPDRVRLVRPRWQAAYDLAMGRALATKVRTEGYNMMLAKAKQGLRFENPKNDTWILRPSKEVSAGSVLQKEADEATAYLTRVITQHPDTPWAMLAEQELGTPLGWTWKEEFRNVIARREAQAAARNRPRDTGPPRPPAKPLRKPPAL